MKELIKKMNLHTINVEGDFIISKEQLETFAKIYHKEQLALYNVVVPNGTLPHKYCPQCGDPIGKSHKFWCEVRD